MSIIDFGRFVDRLATASGEAILPFFRMASGSHSFNMRDKSHGGTFDPVTEADRAAETAMRRLIRESFPGHGIIGEEFGDHQPDADYVWVLDPIDGTKSFISGLPVWGTLIGLQHQGNPVYGMMHQPFTREKFFGDGAGATWQGLDAGGRAASRPITTRSCTALDQATLMTTHPSLMTQDKRERYMGVESQVRLSRHGGDCYAYCVLASGHIDLVIESGLKPYDIAALIPIIEGAGGIVTTWQGESAAKGGDIIAAGDRNLHAQVLKLLNG